MIKRSLIRLTFNSKFIAKKSIYSTSKCPPKAIRFHVNQNKLKYNFSSTTNQSVFIFNVQKEPELLSLELQYRSQQNVFVFQDKIKSSTGVLEQYNIYKIFKVIESCPFNEQSYEQFFNLINNNLKRKSDNMLILLATIKQRIAKSRQVSKNYGSAKKLLEQSLEILQECMVPQLLQYYSVFREYGILHLHMENIQKAKQILTESVNVLDDFVSHSDDHVSTDHFCLKQATAYNVLAQIDTQNNKKWVEKALAIWQNYGQSKCNLIQYAKTVSQNLKILLRTDQQKGEAYFNFNLYKFETKQMKELLKKAKAQVLSK